MQNKRYRDTTLASLPVPVSGVVTGQPYEMGGFFGFSQETKAYDPEDQNNYFTLDRSGGFIVRAKATATNFLACGDAVYFSMNRGDVLFSNDKTEGRLVGYAMIDFVGGKKNENFILLNEGQTGDILVAVEPFPRTTADEAIEDAGGPDA